jgi:hypothetical protein
MANQYELPELATVPCTAEAATKFHDMDTVIDKVEGEADECGKKETLGGGLDGIVSGLGLHQVTLHERVEERSDKDVEEGSGLGKAMDRIAGWVRNKCRY